MKGRVLVVDDYVDAMHLFVEELREAGFDVTGTTKPNVALSLALSTRPDAIVLDLAMPDLDGYELARLLRSYAGTRGVRLIAATAQPVEAGATRLPPGGWDAYLQKPIEPGALAAAVESVLGEAIAS